MTGKLLASNTSGPRPRRWHESSEREGMIPLLFAFVALAALLCAVIEADAPRR